MKKWIWITMLFILGFTAIGWVQPAGAVQSATLSYGKRGTDVPDLQYRLKTVGLFQGEITSYYGPKTTRAVKSFQKRYGLKADGITGPTTWKKLRKVSVNRHELDQVARMIYAEARGEPYKGKVAVGAVIMNRLSSPEFPKTVHGVLFQPWAFTAVHDGQYKLKPDYAAYQAALDAVKGHDPTYNALYYFNPQTATSKWIWTRKQTVKIGRHIFAV
ncbi:spore cortex-lytic enzyme [Paenibacillus gansuensis]|uniref:Spore cortex-lytic enzyme n=1 Tax=Paenibacillus gansuensis TaxID=306542 RepID=A0ABW5PDQ1_9BACL